MRIIRWALLLACASVAVAMMSLEVQKHLVISGVVVIAGSDTPIFSGGSQVQRSMQCANGTVAYTALTAAAASQEITIQTGISGNVRWDQLKLSETTQFTSSTVTALTVSMGRPGTDNIEMTGAQVPLMASSGDVNFWSARPIPPQLTSTYSIVLNFASTGDNVNAFSAGVLDWELCGYAGR